MNTRLGSRNLPKRLPPWTRLLLDSRRDSREGIQLSKCCVNVCIHEAIYGEGNKMGKESSDTNSICAGHTLGRDGRNAYLAKCIKRGMGVMERTLQNSQLFPSVKVPVPPPSLRCCLPRRPSIAPICFINGSGAAF